MNFSRFMIHAAAVAALALAPMFANADENTEAVKAMEEYLAFVDYGGGTISPAQIAKDDWQRFHVIDARFSSTWRHSRFTAPGRWCRRRSRRRRDSPPWL